MNFSDQSSFKFLHKKQLSKTSKENAKPKKHSKFELLKKNIRFKDENVFQEVTQKKVNTQRRSSLLPSQIMNYNLSKGFFIWQLT